MHPQYLMTFQISCMTERDYLFTTQSLLLMTLREKDLENTVGKGENAGNLHFLLLPVFSTLSKRKHITLATFNLSSTNAFNLVMSKILSSGKGLNTPSPPSFYQSLVHLI